MEAIKERDSLEAFQRICRENTGSHMLDSGGIYGYGYNRQNCEKVYHIEESDGEIDFITISTAHFLAAILKTDKFSERLDAAFLKFADKDECSWHENRRDFLGKLNHIEHYQSANTYNFDNALDQVLEYTIFEHDGERYIALQVHTGCDVRGGYTRPYFFKVIDIDYFDLNLQGSEYTRKGKWINDYDGIPPHCKLNKAGEIVHGKNIVHISSTADGF